MAKKAKTVKRKPVVSKKALQEEIKRLQEGIDWGKRIITMQQAEVDRLMKLTDSLTASINNISKWDK